MQTLPQSPTKGLEIVSSSGSQHAVTWNDRVIGMIQAHPSLGLNWEYCRYSEYPKTFIGTYDECCDRARQDYTEQQPRLQCSVVASSQASDCRQVAIPGSSSINAIAV